MISAADCMTGAGYQYGNYAGGTGNNRAMMMRRVQQTGLAMDDARLYLDTHPCDMGAITYFRHMSDLHQQAVTDFSTQWGPITSKESNDMEYWTWINDPWPWEGE